MKAQETNFKPERGLYLIKQVRTWTFGTGFAQIYSIDNRPLLGIQLSNMDYDNNEQYPYMSHWLKHRRIAEISLYDIRPKPGHSFEPSYMLPLERNKLIGNFTNFSKKVYLSAGDDEDDLSIGEIHLRIGPKLIQEIVPSIM